MVKAITTCSLVQSCHVETSRPHRKMAIRMGLEPMIQVRQTCVITSSLTDRFLLCWITNILNINSNIQYVGGSEGSRTLTPRGNRNLNPACLPVPPQTQLAGSLGFEPRLRAPKTRVLPLHHEPMDAETGIEPVTPSL